MAINEIHSHGEPLITSGGMSISSSETCYLTGNFSFETFIDFIPVM